MLSVRSRLHRRARLPGARELRRARRLDADDARLRTVQLHRGRDPRAQPTAADRHDARWPHRGDPATISRPTVPCPAMICGSSYGGTSVAPSVATICERAFHAIGGRRARELDARAQTLGAAALRGSDRRRHHDDRRHAEHLRRERDRLRVVAGRRRNDAARAYGSGIPFEKVVRAAQLEGAAALQHLGLEPHPLAQEARRAAAEFGLRRRRASEPPRRCRRLRRESLRLARWRRSRFEVMRSAVAGRHRHRRLSSRETRGRRVAWVDTVGPAKVSFGAWTVKHSDPPLSVPPF